MNTPMPDDEKLISKIYLLRGQKIMLDRDLAILYGVETRRLNEQVKRMPIAFLKISHSNLLRKKWN